MLRWIKVFAVTYLTYIGSMLLLIGGTPDMLVNLASPLAKVAVVNTVIWCWLVPSYSEGPLSSTENIDKELKDINTEIEVLREENMEV